MGLNKMVKELEGTTDELSIDFKNFKSDLEVLDEEKRVINPGEKIKTHLDTWQREILLTDDEEIHDFAVLYQYL
jgi:hypothetical protein